MTALREELIDYVKVIPEEKLPAIRSLLFTISNESIVIEKLTDNDLTDEELKSFEKAEVEYRQGTSFDFNEYLFKRGI